MNVAEKGYYTKMLRDSSAQQTELLIRAQREATTRFANNSIHQNVVEEETGVKLEREIIVMGG